MKRRRRETFDKVIKVYRARAAAGTAFMRQRSLARSRPPVLSRARTPRVRAAAFGYYENALWYANENLSDVLSLHVCVCVCVFRAIRRV